ncbi:hypothetical protein KAI12_00690 [Candidatus Bathyarchaeota archaeon]|nr:hypothetical protein [Candidatus Bathyarchaeota archaeon]
MRRRCERCKAPLSEEDVMKIGLEDGSWEEIPLPLCPNCFKDRMHELARQREDTTETHS